MRKVILLASAMLACVAAPAAAEPTSSTSKAAMQWEIAYQVLNAADAATTIYCLEKVKGCEETNPIWGKHPSALKVIAAKAAFGALQFYLFNEVRKKDPKMGLRVAQVSVGLQGAVVGLNLRAVF